MMEVASEVKAHAKLSASGSERWLNCPGSVALSENAPPQRESGYAKEGTDAHAVLEVILKNHGKKPYSAARMLKGKYPDAMVEHALRAYKEIEVRIPPGATVLTETKVDLTFVGPDMFGTVDCAIVDEFGTLWVIDYKYGAGVPVDPDENTQLIYYALGIAHKYHFNFADVKLVIIQPRAPHEKGPIREWNMTIEQLMAWEVKFRQGVERVEDPCAELTDGDWCRWCPAATICPKLKEQAMETAAIVFDDDTGALTTPVPEMIKLPNLSNLLTACDRLELWIEKVRDHATTVLEKGHTIEGWKLVEKRSIRKWADYDKASKLARKTFGDGAFSEPELLSPAQLEKALPNAEMLVDKFIKANASDKSSGTTLVSASDKRPAVVPAELVFDDYKAEPLKLKSGKGEVMAKKVKTKGKTKKTAKAKTKKKK